MNQKTTTTTKRKYNAKGELVEETVTVETDYVYNNDVYPVYPWRVYPTTYPTWTVTNGTGTTTNTLSAVA